MAATHTNNLTFRSRWIDPVPRRLSQLTGVQRRVFAVAIVCNREIDN